MDLLLPVLFFTTIIAGIAADIHLVRRLRRNPIDWDRLGDALRQRPWIRQDLNMLLAVLVMVQICVPLTLNGIQLLESGSPANTPVTPMRILAQTGIFCLGSLLTISLLLRRRLTSWSQAFGSFKGRFWPCAKQAAFLYLAAMPPTYAIHFAAQHLLHALGYDAPSQDMVLLLSDPDTPRWLYSYLLILSLAIAPVLEEFIFRGIILPVSLQGTRPLPAILLVSTLFGVMHFNALSFAPLVTIGFFFSLGYLLSNSILVPILMHALFNFVSIAILLFDRTLL